MNWTEKIARLLGNDDVSNIEAVRASFGSAWAHAAPGLVIFICSCLCVLSFRFYLRWQLQGHRVTRFALASLRATTLCLAFLILTDPIAELTFVTLPKPVLWVMLDGSDSMSIPDELHKEERELLANAVDFNGFLASQAQITTPQTSRPTSGQSHPNEAPARADYVRALLVKSKNNLIERLSDSFRLRIFRFAETDGTHLLNSGDAVDGRVIAGEWLTTGTTTSLGDAFEGLARQYSTDNLSAVLVFSDFDQNAGAAPIAAAKKLQAPVFTVGVGPLTAVDLSIDLVVPPTMKQAESSTINVTVRQRELDNAQVQVRLYSHQPGNLQRVEPQRTLIGEKTLKIFGDSSQIDFPYTPESTGRLVFTAEVDSADGEVVVQNNMVEREVNVIDDFLRLMFVEYEPTWEWRFMKEVFHRDKLVGTRGFRTFIRSADPIVRETNELFLPTLTPSRGQFFENDVIFLGDMPQGSLSTRFCEMTKEFVSQFGGGLVVVAGPRFGPGQLAETPLADMLPVVVEADTKRRDDQEFRLMLTPAAVQYDFMRLGLSDIDNLKAWNNLAKLPWYQPVRRVDVRSTRVLAEHPSDTCADGVTRQPLIAIRQYGRGEVVYVGFNEMWRLRRLHGEEFYRQFWGQLIHRLGLSHAIGSHKRFVVRADKSKYRSGDQVLVTVEAYDKEFHPLDEKTLLNHRLTAELIRPESNFAEGRAQTFSVPQLKPGVFETRIPVSKDGEYRLRVSDPISNEIHEISFDVENISIERRNPVRNSILQKNLAAETGGGSYDLTNIDRFPDDFKPVRKAETTVQIITLWNNWLVFNVLVGLLIVEWFMRKTVNLS